MEINEDILIRYIDGMLTEEEAAEVKNWRAASLENEKLLEQVYFTTQVASRLKVMRTVNPDEALSRFKSRIHKKEKRLALRQVLGVIQRAAAVLFIPVSFHPVACGFNGIEGSFGLNWSFRLCSEYFFMKTSILNRKEVWRFL